MEANVKRKQTEDLCYILRSSLKNNLLLSLEKLTSKNLYQILISKKTSIPTSQQYFNSFFPDSNLDWKLLYLLPREICRSTNFRAFQYKIFNNVSYLNLEKLLLLCIPFVNYMTKLWSTFLAVVIKLFHCGLK